MRRFRIVNDLDFDKSMCPDSVFYHEQDDIVEYYREPTVRIWCQEVFQGCTSLTTITIPSSVTYIESTAFEDCSNLTAIHYDGTATGFPWGATNAIRYYD